MALRDKVYMALGTLSTDTVRAEAVKIFPNDLFGTAFKDDSSNVMDGESGAAVDPSNAPSHSAPCDRHQQHHVFQPFNHRLHRRQGQLRCRLFTYL